MNNSSKLIISIIGCELVGILGTLFTATAIPTWYATLNKPFFSPPNWIFGPVWTLLYLLMGVSLYLIWTHKGKKKQTHEAITYFLTQLACNFLWTPIFFGLKSPFLALIVIIVMWILIALTIKKFYMLSKTAGYLLIPYLLWVSFATILNAAILLLN
jgi:translocator protein